MNKVKSNDKTKVKKSVNVFNIAAVTLLAVYSLSLIFMVAWAMLTSVKNKFDFMSGNVFGLPRSIFGGWQYRNYINAFGELSVQISGTSGRAPRDVFMPEMMLNSLLYAVGATLMSLASHFVTAYAVARYKFKLGKVIYMTVIIVMLLPIVGALPSEIIMARRIGFYDNMLGIFLMKCSFTGMNFLIFYATFKGIPTAYSEAAKIDGAGHFAVMLRVVLPLASATVFGVGLLLFIGFWNEYYTPMIYLPSMPTIAYGLYRIQFSASNAVSVPIQLTACIIVAIPILAVVIAFRNRIMGSIGIGGLKG